MERMIQVEKENVEQSVFVEREPMTLNIGGTTDYNGLSNKPSINGTTLSGNKSLSDLGINIPDVSNFITKDVNDLTYYTLATNTGSTIELTINNSTYVMTLNLKNASGTTISTQSIDLPLETMVVNGSYDSTNKKVILTLQNGNTVDFSVADLVSGLQSEITSSNKLSSDLVDDTNHTNKFVTANEKANWNNKSDFSGNYNDLSNKPTIPTKTSDLTNDSRFVNEQTLESSINDVLVYVDMNFPDISGKENTSNKVTSLSSSSTDTQYPSAKCVYDIVGDIETVLTTLTTGNGV